MYTHTWCVCVCVSVRWRRRVIHQVFPRQILCIHTSPTLMNTPLYTHIILHISNIRCKSKYFYSASPHAIQKLYILPCGIKLRSAITPPCPARTPRTCYSAAAHTHRYVRVRSLFCSNHTHTHRDAPAKLNIEKPSRINQCGRACSVPSITEPWADGRTDGRTNGRTAALLTVGYDSGPGDECGQA